MMRLADSPRIIRQRKWAARAHAVAHLRDEVESQIELRRVPRPGSSVEPVALTVTPPRKGTEGVDGNLDRWCGRKEGLTHGAVDSLPLLADGGWRHLDISPRMPHLMAMAVRAADHDNALPWLVALARCLPFGEWTLSEAAAASRELMLLDPRAESQHPQGSANAWAGVGLTLINAWQRRADSGRGLGDVTVIAEVVADIRDRSARLQVRQAEIDLENARRGRYRGDRG